MKKGQYTMLNTKQQDFVKHALEKFGKSQLTVGELKEANAKFGCKYAPQWLIKNKDYKVGKSLFKLPVDGEAKSVPVKKISKSLTANEKILVPQNETKKEAAYVVSSLTGNIIPKKDPISTIFPSSGI